MARLVAYQAFDIRNLDWNILVRNQTYFDFYDNAFETFEGVTYEDVLDIGYFSGGLNFAALFGGTGVTWDASFTTVTSGTVTGFAEQVWNGSVWETLYLVDGLNVSAVDVGIAVNSSTRADDVQVVTSALSGDDSITLSNFADAMAGFGGNDRLVGNGGNDILEGNAGRDVLLGGFGADNLSGGGQNDTLKGQAGNDFLRGDGGRDKLFGNGGSDELIGGGGGDRMDGGGGSDEIKGQAGGDRLIGRGGKDVLNGGKGDDVLSGGKHGDTFVFSKGDGQDTITDFNVNADTIAIGAGASRFGQLDIRQSGSDTEISFRNVTITLLDVDASDVTSDIFEF